MRQVAVNSLKIGDMLDKTIYSSSGRVLLGKGIKLTPLYISRLKDMGISTVYIQDDRFNDVIAEDIIKEEDRREAMQMIENCTQAVRSGKDINGFELKSVISNIVEQIVFKKDILITVMDMRTQDNHIFAHSVNVCVLSIILGKAKHLDQEKLETLAVGALLHDIGLIKLASELLSKGPNLTQKDRELYRTHSLLGFEELRKRKDLSILAAHIAFQHHEYLDGTGFPRGLKEIEIHPLAQIVAVADLYDRLTSDHSDLKKVMPHEAIEILMGLSAKTLQFEAVCNLLKNIAAYPTGMTVKLNTGEIGVVVEQNMSMPTRPIVRVFDELDITDMASSFVLQVGHSKEYDLVKERTIFIQEIVN